jgi:hypothetical protein
MKAWRCELTALSQLYNLYFLASNDTIHVYRPSFPDQNLSSEPELILHPPVSAQTGPGIDQLDPHSITRILVDYLGNQEILLLTCDDGDAVGYRTEEIHRALERRTNRLEPANEDDVHHFLHLNVGASAWGLAVHREARIIAISANTHRITIIAYALAGPVNEPEASDSDVPESLSSMPNFPYSRQEENIIILEAHTNLPALSFDNNGDDRSGRWLFSSSIDGKTTLWDLRERKAARIFQLGWCASSKSPSDVPEYGPYGSQCDCIDRTNVIHGAWGAMMLDTRSAYEMTPMEELTLEPKNMAPCFRDVSAHKKRFTVQKHSPYVPYMPSSESEDELSDIEVEEAESIATEGAEQEAAHTVREVLGPADRLSLFRSLSQTSYVA